MRPVPKPPVSEARSGGAPTRPGELGLAPDISPSRAAAPPSPARTLQETLRQTFAAPATGRAGHMAGLVLTVLLACAVAGISLFATY